MSKTYIHMRRYHAKHYYKNQPEEYVWLGPFRMFLGHNKKDIHEPNWDTLYRYNHSHSNHTNMEKFWFRNSNRKYRRLVKKLIRQERYGDIPHKPENVDWSIC